MWTKLGSTILIITTALVPAVAFGAEGNDANEAKCKKLMEKQGDGSVTVCYDHRDASDDGDASRSYSLKLKDGQPFRVVIKRTCPEAFEYDERILELAETRQERVAPACESKEVTVDFTHRRGNGLYIVEIERKPGVDEQQATVDNVVLKEAEVAVTVATQGWHYEFSGAFTTSELTDPKFALQEETTMDAEGNETQQMIVIRDEAAEDDARLGLGAFIHAYSSRLPQLAGTFGVGLNEANETTYYTGLSWRWAGKGALTVGYNWGSVDRLDPGIQVGQATMDTNAVSNLDTRVDGDWFFAFSYPFLSPGEAALKKRFEGSGSARVTNDKKDDEVEEQEESRQAESAERVEQSSAQSLRSIRLEWPQDPKALSYQIYRSSKSCNAVSKPYAETQTNTFVDKNAIMGQTYYYKIQSIRREGLGELGDCIETGEASTTQNME